MFIHWDKSLETGHPLVDAEHRILVLLFRKLDVAIKTHQSSEVVRNIVREVVRCVEFHFQSEENLMRETSYPDLSAHQALHAELLLELSAFVARIASHRDFPEDLLSFLSCWLWQHIATHDQLVTQHVSTSPHRPIAELAYPEYLGLTQTQGTPSN
jgi:hemerythrin-like metal-binding protein